MITITGCSKSFPSRDGRDSIKVVDRLDLTIADREFVCVLGPSGCGKTTLLWMLAGLVRPDEGEIAIDGRVVTAPGADRGMVFQDFALLPWADVLTNIAFGLELRGVAREERLARAARLAAAVGLHGFEHHYPRELSGGMQQRVSLARALAIEPSILLMDEPFGALDEMTRERMNQEVLGIWERTGITVVFVTHSIPEAVFLSSRVVVMSARPGRVTDVIEIDLPRPRDVETREQPRYFELVTDVREALRRGEVR
jgi:ABC-type nitrate/sulfonate/bicarbonate transport system ATPase subunit